MTNFFILLSFCFPRVTLLIFWLLNAIPEHTTPFAVDIIGFAFAPRFLIAWWLYNFGMHPLLIIFFVIAQFIEFDNFYGKDNKRKKRKKK